MRKKSPERLRREAHETERQLNYHLDLVRNRIEQEVVSSKVVKNGTGFDIEEIEVSLPNGEIESYDRLSMGPVVGIVCLDRLTNEVVLIAQSRVAVDEIIYEVPAGHVEDSDESLEAAACRELREETGIIISEDQLVRMPTIYPSPGVMDEEIHFFYTEQFDIEADRQSLDSDEFIDMVRVDFQRFVDYIVRAEGSVDAKTAFGILAYNQLRGSESIYVDIYKYRLLDSEQKGYIKDLALKDSVDKYSGEKRPKMSSLDLEYTIDMAMNFMLENRDDFFRLRG